MVIDKPSDIIPATSLKLTGNNEKIPEPDTGQMNFTGLSIIQTPTLALFIVTDGHWLREAKFYGPHFCVKTLYTLSVNRPFLLPYFWDKKEYWTCSCLRMLGSFTLVNLNVHILIEF